MITLGIWIDSAASALLFYYFTIVAEASLEIWIRGSYIKHIFLSVFLSYVGNLKLLGGGWGEWWGESPLLLRWPLYWRLKATASNVSCFHRLGYTLPGKCRPSMSFNDDASQLKWSDIRQHWFYDDLSLGGYRSPSVIPVITNIFTTDT